MNKIVHLSLSRKNVPTYIDVVQGATAPGITFVLDDYTPDATARARLYIKKTDAEVYNDCTLSGNQVIYNPTAGSFDEPGQCVAQLQITKGNTIAVSWRIFVKVEPNLIEGSAAPASTEYGALETLINNAQAYDTIIAANNITGYNNGQGFINLPSDADLNNYKDPGIYVTSAVNSANMINKPVNYNIAFRLTVEQVNAYNGNLKQTVEVAGRNLSIGTESQRGWTRNGDGTYDGWEPWTRLPHRNEINVIANNGAKNLVGGFPLYYVGAGITFIRNDDGSITANGTSTDTSITTSKGVTLPPGSYQLTGCPSGGSATTYRIRPIVNGTVVGGDEGNGYTLTLNSTAEVKLRIYIYAAQGEVTDLTFYPMLRNTQINDETYVPFGETNAGLTADLSDLRVITDFTNATQYVFNVTRPTSRFCTALIVGGTAPDKVYLGLLFCEAGANNDGIVDVINTTGRTLSVSVVRSNNNLDLEITITTSSTMYGGLRFVWLDN